MKAIFLVQFVLDLSFSLELQGVSTILRYLARAGKDGLYGSDALSAVQVHDIDFTYPL